jgi:hypothetical protein
MKKILVVAIMAVCFTWNIGFCATVDLDGDCEYVSASRETEICTYTSTTSITTGNSQVFNLAIPKPTGNIVGVGIDSLSTDLDWWVSTTEDAAATAISTIIWEKETNLGISLVYGGMFSGPIWFFCDSNSLFLTLDNDGAEDVTTMNFYLVFGNSSK